ncbi:MAG: mechanosensitive ion channel family protein [Pseudomonadota bacterium]
MRVLGQIPGRAAWFCAVMAVLISCHFAVTAHAQIPGYDLLGGNSEPEQPAEPRQSQPVPAQSRPQLPEPTVEDYGRIAETVPDPMLDATNQAVGVFRARLQAMAERLPGAIRELDTALILASPTGQASYFLGIAIFAGLLLVIGRAFTMMFYIYVSLPIMIRFQETERIGYRGKLPVLAYRLMFTIIGIAITVSVATAVGLVFYQEHQPTTTTVIVVFAAYALVLVVDTIWRMALAPYLSSCRIPALSDAAARSVYRWISGISIFGLMSMAFSYWFQALRLAAEVHTAITIILAGITVLALLVMARVQRHSITRIILGGKPRDEVSWPQLVGATLWGPLLSVYLVLTWGDLSVRLIMGLEQAPFRLGASYLIFISGIVIYAIAAYAIERIFARSREIAAMNAHLDAQRAAEEAAFQQEIRDKAAGVGDGPEDADGDGDGDDGGGSAVETVENLPPRRPGMRTLEDLARRAASLFAIGAVTYTLIRYWGGPDVFERNVVLNLVEDVIDILFLGYLVFHAVRIWVDTKIAEEIGDEDPNEIAEGEGGGAGATRLATILPLFRNFLLISIVVGILLLLLVEFGVNVAPLFAGAGIVGLAIGFGSQTLVRDILSGAFFLADDAFRKGEYIDVGEVKGTVEKISLRSFQLRHHLGKLHTIPFGEIQYLTNFSRDWVMMKLPLRLTYDTDVEQVRKLVKKLGLRLLEDPDIGDKFIQPLKSQGVIQMDDSAMILRLKFMTYPGEQWVIRKRVLADIRELFAAEGIKFAHREVTVRIPDLPEDRQLTADEKAAIGAAARRSVDAVEEEMAPAAAGGDVR